MSTVASRRFYQVPSRFWVTITLQTRLKNLYCKALNDTEFHRLGLGNWVNQVPFKVIIQGENHLRRCTELWAFERVYLTLLSVFFLFYQRKIPAQKKLVFTTIVTGERNTSSLNEWVDKIISGNLEFLFYLHFWPVFSSLYQGSICFSCLPSEHLEMCCSLL